MPKKRPQKAIPAKTAKDQTVIRVPETLPYIELPGGRSVAIGRTHPPAEQGYWVRFRRAINAGHQDTQIGLSDEAMQALHTLTGWYGFKAPDVLTLTLEVELPASLAKIVNGGNPPGCEVPGRVDLQVDANKRAAAAKLIPRVRAQVKPPKGKNRRASHAGIARKGKRK